MKVYTRAGDDGSTGLADGCRVSKRSTRVAAYGEVDELNAVLGVLRSETIPDPAAGHLVRVQNVLFDIGAALADPRGRTSLTVDAADATWVEAWIDAMEADLPPLRNFVLPAGTRSAALAHQARAVCRRAERLVVALAEEDRSAAGVLPVLNRLSDALFVLARWLNRRAGLPDVAWRPRG